MKSTVSSRKKEYELDVVRYKMYPDICQALRVALGVTENKMASKLTSVRLCQEVCKEGPVMYLPWEYQQAIYWRTLCLDEHTRINRAKRDNLPALDRTYFTYHYLCDVLICAFSYPIQRSKDQYVVYSYENPIEGYRQLTVVKMWTIVLKEVKDHIKETEEKIPMDNSFEVITELKEIAAELKITNRVLEIIAKSDSGLAPLARTDEPVLAAVNMQNLYQNNTTSVLAVPSGVFMQYDVHAIRSIAANRTWRVSTPHKLYIAFENYYFTSYTVSSIEKINEIIGDKGQVRTTPRAHKNWFILVTSDDRDLLKKVLDYMPANLILWEAKRASKALKECFKKHGPTIPNNP